MALMWSDVREIAAELAATYPQLEPLELAGGDLRRLVADLPEFGDDPLGGSVRTLEAVRIAWMEELEADEREERGK